MMRIRELVTEWQKESSEALTESRYNIRLPIHDAAKIEALAELFPGRTREQFITELLGAALDELEASFAYQPGNDVAGYDEMGDPMYADAGLTPYFQELAKKHAERLSGKEKT